MISGLGQHHAARDPDDGARSEHRGLKARSSSATSKILQKIARPFETLIQRADRTTNLPESEISKGHGTRRQDSRLLKRISERGRLISEERSLEGLPSSYSEWGLPHCRLPALFPNDFSHRDAMDGRYGIGRAPRISGPLLKTLPGISALMPRRVERILSRHCTRL